jgi:predicted metal-dependent hydrolase
MNNLKLFLFRPDTNYVIAHEMIHLIEPTHNKNFIKLLTTHYPNWQTAKAELNSLPLVAETWD